MKYKVILEYDPENGNIYDVNGANISCWFNLESFPSGEGTCDSVIEPTVTGLSPVFTLLKSGLTVEDIVTLKNEGLL